MLVRTCFLVFLGSVAFETRAAAEAKSPESRMSAAIKSGLPKYDPPAIRDSTIVGDSVDGSSPILLPRFIVREPKLPVFSERDLHTMNGRDALLLARYPGMSRKGDYARKPLEAVNYAMQMYEDDERFRSLKDLGDFADILRLTGDNRGSDRLKAEIQRSFRRRSDARSEAIEKSTGGGRR